MNRFRDMKHHHRRHSVAESLPLLGITPDQDKVIREGTDTLQFSYRQFTPLNRMGTRNVCP